MIIYIEIAVWIKRLQYRPLCVDNFARRQYLNKCEGIRRFRRDCAMLRRWHFVQPTRADAYLDGRDGGIELSVDTDDFTLLASSNHGVALFDLLPPIGESACVETRLHELPPLCPRSLE